MRIEIGNSGLTTDDLITILDNYINYATNPSRKNYTDLVLLLYNVLPDESLPPFFISLGYKYDEIPKVPIKDNDPNLGRLYRTTQDLDVDSSTSVDSDSQNKFATYIWNELLIDQEFFNLNYEQIEKFREILETWFFYFVSQEDSLNCFKDFVITINSETNGRLLELIIAEFNRIMKTKVTSVDEIYKIFSTKVKGNYNQSALQNFSRSVILLMHALSPPKENTTQYMT